MSNPLFNKAAVTINSVAAVVIVLINVLVENNIIENAGIVGTILVAAKLIKDNVFSSETVDGIYTDWADEVRELAKASRAEREYAVEVERIANSSII